MSRASREKGRKARVVAYREANPEPIELKQPYVCALIPCYKHPHPRMTHQYTFMEQYARQHGIKLEAQPLLQSSVVHWTRNQLLKNLILTKKPFSHVLFMDDDIIPPADAVVKMVKHGVDIVAGLCTKRQDPPMPNIRHYDPEARAYREMWEWQDGLIEVGGVGTGLMLISRNALQLVTECWMNCDYEKDVYGVSDEWVAVERARRVEAFEKEPNAWWFRFAPIKGWTFEVGEDIFFCHLAREYCGLKVHVDTTIQPEHMGDYGFKIDDFLQYRDPIIAQAKAEGRYIAAPQLPRVEGAVFQGEKISLLVPTRGRPKNLKRLAKSIAETSHELPEIVMYVDDDDESMQKWVGKDGDGVKIVVGPRRTLSECWNECAKVATGNLLMVAADDIVFTTKGWDSIVRKAFADSPDKLIMAYGDDGFWGPRLGTHPIVHRRWYEALGYITPPYFSADYCDTWVNEIAEALGRRVYLPFVNEHLHPLWGKAKADATYREKFERAKLDNVEGKYKDMAAERAQDVEKLRAAMEPVLVG